MKKWEKFERAVAEFVAALDPNAKVEHNVRRPDRDTGSLRQRDVWVETKVCNFFPLKILISCKSYKRRLNEQDIDHFIGELESSGAHKGILFTNRGFCKPALQKAEVRGITCCKLFDDEPVPPPLNLQFNFYCCTSSVSLGWNSDSPDSWTDTLFSDVFIMEDEQKINVIDYLISEFWKNQREVVRSLTKPGEFPKPWLAAVDIKREDTPLLRLLLRGRWRVYRAKLECQLIRGTYIFNNGAFFGNIASPKIDTQSSKPGIGWELINEPYSALHESYGIVILEGGNVKDILTQNFGNIKIGDIGRNEK